MIVAPWRSIEAARAVGLVGPTIGDVATAWASWGWEHGVSPGGLSWWLGTVVLVAWVSSRVGGAVARKRWAAQVVEKVDQRCGVFHGAPPTESSPGVDDDLRPVEEAIERWVHVVQAERDEWIEEARLVHSLLEMSPSGVLVIDSYGAIRLVNPAFRTLVSLRGEPIGKTPIEVVPVAEVQVVVDIALHRGEGAQRSCSSGRTDLYVQSVPLQEGGVLVAVHDVTSFRQAERARTDFVANVSHELRTPIASILGYSETLLYEPDRLGDDLPLVQAIHRNGRRLSDLFEDLLHLSRIEARRAELPLDSKPIAPIIRSAVTSAADRASQRRQRFELECPETVTAPLNAEALTAIVSNLVTNASNYTPEGGRIRVGVVDDPEWVRIDVEDTGIGIDPAHQERIFERFYRVDEGRSRQAGGTGLGLAIVKHLAMASGCRVTVESDPGRGSTFSVWISKRGRVEWSEGGA